jgi:hypothetical protein
VPPALLEIQEYVYGVVLRVWPEKMAELVVMDGHGAEDLRVWFGE